MSTPRFAIGDILRYGEGSTALMRVAYISANHGGKGHHRYYGQQCMGGTCGAYENNCEPASTADRKTWHEVRQKYADITPWHKFVKRLGKRDIVGAVED